MRVFLTHLRSIDWLLVVPIILIMVCGLITNFPAEGFSFDSFFFRQLLFVLLGIGIIICGSMNTYTILKGSIHSVSFILFFRYCVDRSAVVCSGDKWCAELVPYRPYCRAAG